MEVKRQTNDWKLIMERSPKFKPSQRGSLRVKINCKLHPKAHFGWIMSKNGHKDVAVATFYWPTVVRWQVSGRVFCAHNALGPITAHPMHTHPNWKFGTSRWHWTNPSASEQVLSPWFHPSLSTVTVHRYSNSCRNVTIKLNTWVEWKQGENWGST